VGETSVSRRLEGLAGGFVACGFQRSFFWRALCVMDCQIQFAMVKSPVHLLQSRKNLEGRFISLMAHRLAVSLLLFILPTTASLAQNRALKLDGKGSYVELPPDIFKDLTQSTIEVWAKWSELNAFSRIFEFGAGYQSVSLFNHSTNSDLRFNIYPRMARNDPSAMNVATARGLLRTNEWIHVAAVSGPGGMKLYANGRLVAQHTNATTFADIKVTQTNLLGRGLARNPTDRDFRGEMDEVRVWDHRRTLEEIRENMFKRLTGKEAGLMALWNFEDGTANDMTPNGYDGKLIGKARVGNTDLDLARALLPTPPPAAVPVTGSPPATVAAINPSAVSRASDSGPVAWWIAGALFSLVAVLAWLALMFRRSSLGSSKLLAAPLPTLGEASVASLPPAAQQEMKERALAELTSFAKESLVQGLYSQRAALLETHKKAQQELAELEARVVALRLPERIQVYETRIAELEGRLDSRNSELHELTHATLELLRQKLTEEKQKGEPGKRFN
jgi:hypothetical protein